MVRYSRYEVGLKSKNSALNDQLQQFGIKCYDTFESSYVMTAVVRRRTSLIRDVVCSRCSVCDVHCTSDCLSQRDGKCDTSCETGYSLQSDYTCACK